MTAGRPRVAPRVRRIMRVRSVATLCLVSARSTPAANALVRVVNARLFICETPAEANFDGAAGPTPSAPTEIRWGYEVRSKSPVFGCRPIIPSLARSSLIAGRPRRSRETDRGGARRGRAVSGAMPVPYTTIVARPRRAPAVGPGARARLADDFVSSAFHRRDFVPSSSFRFANEATSGPAAPSCR